MVINLLESHWLDAWDDQIKIENEFWHGQQTVDNRNCWRVFIWKLLNFSWLTINNKRMENKFIEHETTNSEIYQNHPSHKTFEIFLMSLQFKLWLYCCSYTQFMCTYNHLTIIANDKMLISCSVPSSNFLILSSPHS